MSCRGISPCKKKLLIWLSYFNFAQKLPVNQLNYMYNVYSLCMSSAFSNVKRTFNLTIANDLIHCRIYTPMESLSSGVCSLSSWSSLSLPLLLSLSDPVTGKTIINEGSTSYYPLNVLLKISVFILQFEYLFKLFVFSSRRICFKFFLFILIFLATIDFLFVPVLCNVFLYTWVWPRIATVGCPTALVIMVLWVWTLRRFFFLFMLGFRGWGSLGFSRCINNRNQ